MATPPRSYRNTAPGILAAESAAERARRNGISPPPLPVVDEAQPDGPLSAPREWHREMHGEDAQPAPAAPESLKGAVKVGAFPDRTRYPFREIAADGDIWRIDPAAFRTKPQSVRSAASKWSTERGLTAKTVIDAGMVYVQFTSHEETQ